MNVFGISIEGGALESMMARIKEAKQTLWIVTANPEILLEARRDAAYAHAIAQADVRSVDGAGLAMIGRLFGAHWSRVTGVELGEQLIAYAQEEGLKVGFIGGFAQVAQTAAEYWGHVHPGLRTLAEQGGRVAFDGTDDEMGEEARHRLTLFAPDILLVAFGHPKQERWIARYASDFPSLKVVVGVGGTFDYWAKRIPRAPRFLQMLGLEWMWRLCLEPRRIVRILRAVVLFPVLAIVDQLFS
jgi:N-acetylglucosaminyldiphosphoundecaprenol N-acetyl-beta-D-mannosaminyltransferase